MFLKKLNRNFAGSAASTELVLSIAFVEFGIRLSIESRLPSAGHQIKTPAHTKSMILVVIAFSFGK